MRKIIPLILISSLAHAGFLDTMNDAYYSKQPKTVVKEVEKEKIVPVASNCPEVNLPPVNVSVVTPKQKTVTKTVAKKQKVQQPKVQYIVVPPVRPIVVHVNSQEPIIREYNYKSVAGEMALEELEQNRLNDEIERGKRLQEKIREALQ